MIQETIEKNSPPYRLGKQGKIYYGTQIGVLPPTFVLFVNYPKLFSRRYRRYLYNQFRLLLDLPEVPIRLDFKERKRKEEMM